MNPMPPHDESILKVLRESLTTVETFIGHEIALQGSRMTWFAISQSFLFGAYLALSGSLEPMGHLGISEIVIAIGLPGVGASFAFATHLSVRAGKGVFTSLLGHRGKLLKKANPILGKNGYPELPALGPAGYRATDLEGTDRYGDAPLLLLPVGMVVVWILLLVLAIVR